MSMLCSRCAGQTKVKDTQDLPDGSTRRRRECKSCGHRFNTVERREDDDLAVKIRFNKFWAEFREEADRICGE